MMILGIYLNKLITDTSTSVHTYVSIVENALKHLRMFGECFEVFHNSFLLHKNMVIQSVIFSFIWN